MPVIATDTSRYSQVIKYEESPDTGFHKDRATVNDAATTLVVGTVMGKVTASGKWKVCKQAAVDGSQNASGIYVGDLSGAPVSKVIPATTDTDVLLFVRGMAHVGASGLVWDASFTTQAQKDAAFAAGLGAQLVLVNPQL